MSDAEIEAAAESAFISIAVFLRGGLDGKVDLQKDWDELSDPVRVAFCRAVREIVARIGGPAAPGELS